MAEAPSVRSRSARSEGQSTARRQTGALHAAGVDYERLLTERGRQDHAGQQKWNTSDNFHTILKTLQQSEDTDLLIYVGLIIQIK